MKSSRACRWMWNLAQSLTLIGARYSYFTCNARFPFDYFISKLLAFTELKMTSDLWANNIEFLCPCFGSYSIKPSLHWIVQIFTQNSFTARSVCHQSGLTEHCLATHSSNIENLVVDLSSRVFVVGKKNTRSKWKYSKTESSNDDNRWHLEFIEPQSINI